MSTLSPATAPATATTHTPLSENARTVLAKRYLRKGPDGQPVETPEQMFRRVARAIAQPEAVYGGDAAATEESISDLAIAGLEDLDQVAYIRRAIVYLGAQDVEAVQREVHRIL